MALVTSKTPAEAGAASAHHTALRAACTLRCRVAGGSWPGDATAGRLPGAGAAGGGGGKAASKEHMQMRDARHEPGAQIVPSYTRANRSGLDATVHNAAPWGAGPSRVIFLSVQQWCARWSGAGQPCNCPWAVNSIEVLWGERTRVSTQPDCATKLPGKQAVAYARTAPRAAQTPLPWSEACTNITASWGAAACALPSRHHLRCSRDCTRPRTACPETSSCCRASGRRRPTHGSRCCSAAGSPCCSYPCLCRRRGCPEQNGARATVSDAGGAEDHLRRFLRLLLLLFVLVVSIFGEAQKRGVERECSNLDL